jgi:hypothetical protein
MVGVADKKHGTPGRTAAIQRNGRILARRLTMSSGISGANSQMAELMQILMQGLKDAGGASMAAVTVNVENSVAADKMTIAQSIIDAYA